MCLRDDTDDNNAEVHALKKKAFNLAKDLMSAEKELAKMQQEISGVLQGVEKDFR